MRRRYIRFVCPYCACAYLDVVSRPQRIVGDTFAIDEDGPGTAQLDAQVELGDGPEWDYFECRECKYSPRQGRRKIRNLPDLLAWLETRNMLSED